MSADSVNEIPFDVIIVGAGAAGCVLAGRLSEASEKRVLLIEAGPDAPADHEHPDIRDPFPVSYGNPRFLWPNLLAETGADPGDGTCRATLPFLQGFGVGGGSNINGMAADRGIPQDYDEWANHGVTGWSWNEVLPYFKKLERDLDFSGTLHGSEGPIPVRRVAPSEWAALNAAIARALKRRGFSLIDDYNAEGRDGVSATPMNCLPNQRVSASMGYLPQAVRDRSNLSIMANTILEHLEAREGCVQGVVVRTADGQRRFRAHETIVSCGAVFSPAILMRSGIGDARSLRALGIEVILDLPAVGRNLQNHPVVMQVMHLPRAGRQRSAYRAAAQNHLRYSSKCAGCPEHDMLIIALSKVAWHPLGQRVAALLINVLKTYSKGSVELTSRDFQVPPRIRFNLLSDPRDFERLVGGLLLTSELLGETEVRAVRNEVFLPNGQIIARLSKRSVWSWLQAWMIAKVFDIGPIRRRLLRQSTLDVATLAMDDGALRRFVRSAAQAVYHVCGTCRMGAVGDREAVVDSTCRVLGIAGLRVVDASIFPTIPSGNTHLPVMMAAEKIADQIKAEWRTAGKQ